MHKHCRKMTNCTNVYTRVVHNSVAAKSLKNKVIHKVIHIIHMKWVWKERFT